MRRGKTRQLALSALFTALTAVGAFFKIPFPLAAISLQFFFTAMAGVLLGARWGAVSQAVYVLLGLVGLPIFSLGGGISYVLQPTFGFVLGLVPAAWVIGRLASRPVRFGCTLAAMLAGLGVVYAVGLAHLALITRVYFGQQLAVSALLRAGMLVYLPGDAVKLVCASLLCPVLWRRLGAAAGEKRDTSL